MLIGLNGPAGAGKDTVANILVDNYGFTRYAFADAVREAALAINPIIFCGANGTSIRLSYLVKTDGWDRAKREVPEVRRLLQVIGTEVGRQILGENCWVDIIARKLVQDGCVNAVITDLRFPNEAEFVLNNRGNIVRIERPDNPNAIATTHASEQFVPEADFTIINDGSLTDLEYQVSSVFRRGRI